MWHISRRWTGCCWANCGLSFMTPRPLAFSYYICMIRVFTRFMPLTSFTAPCLSSFLMPPTSHGFRLCLGSVRCKCDLQPGHSGAEAGYKWREINVLLLFRDQIHFVLSFVHLNGHFCAIDRVVYLSMPMSYFTNALLIQLVQRMEDDAIINVSFLIGTLWKSTRP